MFNVSDLSLWYPSQIRDDSWKGSRATVSCCSWFTLTCEGIWGLTPLMSLAAEVFGLAGESLGCLTQQLSGSTGRRIYLFFLQSTMADDFIYENQSMLLSLDNWELNDNWGKASFWIKMSVEKWEIMKNNDNMHFVWTAWWFAWFTDSLIHCLNNWLSCRDSFVCEYRLCVV